MAGWQKSNRRILMTVAIIYVSFCFCGCALQRKLLFFPAKIPANAVVQAAAQNGFAPWKNPEGEIIGWKIPANGNATGSVLIVHGNAGSAIDRSYLAQPIHEAESLDVFVLEYPGYGAREGSPSRKSFNAAAEEAFQLMPKNLPRYVVSESIGTGVACELAKNHPSEIAGMTLFVPYHNLASVAQHRIWFLPSYFLLIDRFDPEDCLKIYHGPIKFVIAEKDEVIGAASGLKLADGYSGPKQIQVVPNAHHNDVEAQSPDWWREVFSFWQKFLPRQ
jgi:pimeloyl-ACP methyl ester carboxylesterase